MAKALKARQVAVKANETANRYVELLKEEKRLAEEKKQLIETMRSYVKETGSKLIGDLVMAYEKASAPKLVSTTGGKTDAAENELMARIGDDYKRISLDVKSIHEAVLQNNKVLTSLLTKLKLTTEVTTEIYFKHV